MTEIARSVGIAQKIGRVGVRLQPGFEPGGKTVAVHVRALLESMDRIGLADHVGAVHRAQFVRPPAHRPCDELLALWLLRDGCVAFILRALRHLLAHFACAQRPWNDNCLVRVGVANQRGRRLFMLVLQKGQLVVLPVDGVDAVLLPQPRGITAVDHALLVLHVLLVGARQKNPVALLDALDVLGHLGNLVELERPGQRSPGKRPATE